MGKLCVLLTDGTNLRNVVTQTPPTCPLAETQYSPKFKHSVVRMKLYHTFISANIGPFDVSQRPNLEEVSQSNKGPSDVCEKCVLMFQDSKISFFLSFVFPIPLHPFRPILVLSSSS